MSTNEICKIDMADIISKISGVKSLLNIISQNEDVKNYEDALILLQENLEDVRLELEHIILN